MFSGNNTPPPRVSTPRRTTTRRTSRIVPNTLQSGQTTPRNASPPPPPSTIHSTLTPRTLNLPTSRSLAGSPVPSFGIGNNNSSSRRINKSVIGVGSEVGSMMMEIEEGKKEEEQGDKILVKDENFVLLERKGLPTEVEQIILTAANNTVLYVAVDTYRDPFRASLDSTTGFAYLVSRDFCLVWNWSRRSSSSTTYVFPLPVSTSLPAAISAFSPLCFACLVPSSTNQSQREPGLLITSTTGEIRYWESLSMALSGVDKFKSINSNLIEGELIRNITLLSPTTYLLSTSQSRILSITLSSIGGRTELLVKPLEKERGWAGSVWGAVFGSKIADPRAGILALALSSSELDDERLGYAITEKDVQVWRLPNRGEGGERLLVEQDLFKGVLEAYSNEEGIQISSEEWATNPAQVEIVDAVVTSTGSLAVLVSHINEATAVNTSSYAIVLLEVGLTPNSVKAVGVRHLAYQPHMDPRPLSSPKLSLQTGEIAFVIFVDTLVMLSLTQKSFEETFPLRSNTNRFIGISVASLTSTTHSLTLLTSTASLLTLEVSPPQGLVFDLPGSEGFETRKLKSKIEQAIFFEGDDENNPLAFKLLRDYKGDLITAAEAVSAEILASSAANMPSILDIRTQIADRSTRARALINFISSNGLLGKLSQTSRRRLSMDAERLEVASALWQHQNTRLDDPNSVLTNAVATFMSEAGESFVEAPLRHFYRTKVQSIGGLVEQITKFSKSLLNSNASAGARSVVLQEANHILILLYNAVARHRKAASSIYAFDSHVYEEVWTSLPAFIESIQWHFDATDALLQQRVREMGTVLDEEQANYSGKRRGGAVTDRSDQQALHAEFKTQMNSLAEFVLASYLERRTYLETRDGKTVTSPESRIITERYNTVRPRLIRTLVSIDKVTEAYQIAETFEDWDSLVELCNDPQHGSESRTRFFMQKYDEKFAFSLYNFFVTKGLLQPLLNQDEQYRPFLTKFLDETSNSHISWIHDFAINRYDHAAETLSVEATKQKDLAKQKLLLSLAKLSEVAQATSENIKSERVQRAIEAIDDRLDLVTSQQALYSLFKKNLSSSQSRLSLDNQGEVITSTLAPSLHNRPAFAQLYVKLSKQVLQEQVLSSEDLIDIMTLKENIGEQAEDFAAAVGILVRSKNIPEARHNIALQSIWRRIYLHDNWEVLQSSNSLNDEELSEALRSTALYATLIALATAGQPLEVYLEPQRCFFNGTSEELSARLPDFSSQSIDLLLNDYELENQMIQESLQHHRLIEFTAEIYRLFNGRI